MMLSDRIVVMSKGHVEQEGSPREIYDHPASRFVAGFIGEMNFLDAGDGKQIAVRPENVTVLPGIQGDGIRGVVRTIMMLGHYLEMTLDTTFAGYITERQRVDIREALLYCTALVSLKMETPGPFQGTRQDVLDYIREFYRP